MRPAHDTERGGAANRGATAKLARLAALVALVVQLTGLRWGEPFLCDVSPDSTWPLRSLWSVEHFPFGELPSSDSKYPDAWPLLTGVVESLAARVVLDRSERDAITALRDRVASEARRAVEEAQRQGTSGDFDVMRPLLEQGGGLERSVWKLVLAGRITTLLLAVVLSLAASAIAGEFVGARFGWIAGLLVGLAPATVHYAATLNTDVPALAWCALAWALALRGARSGRGFATFLASGASMGLAAATKDQVVAALPGVVAFAFARRAEGESALAWPKRLFAIALGAALAYVPTSGLLHPSGPNSPIGSAWTSHVSVILGDASQRYREFERSFAGTFGLLRATGGKLLAAGAVAGVGGLCALLLVVAFVRRSRGARLAVLLPAVTYTAFFLVPIGYVYPRFTLPIVLCTSIGFAVAIGCFAEFVRARAGGAAGVVVSLVVAIVALVEARGVVVAKWSDPRPASVAALAARRAPADEVWVAAQAWFMAPFPPIEAPRRFTTISELAFQLNPKSTVKRPRFVWLAVDSHGELASETTLRRAASDLGLELLERFPPTSSCRLADDRDGLLLPTVALFESKPQPPR